MWTSTAKWKREPSCGKWNTHRDHWETNCREAWRQREGRGRRWISPLLKNKTCRTTKSISQVEKSRDWVTVTDTCLGHFELECISRPWRHIHLLQGLSMDFPACPVQVFSTLVGKEPHNFCIPLQPEELWHSILAVERVLPVLCKEVSLTHRP